MDATPITPAKEAPKEADLAREEEDRRALATLKEMIAEGEVLNARLDKLEARIEGDRRHAREAVAYIRRENFAAPPPATLWVTRDHKDLDLEIRAIDEDQRRISGVATTPNRDRAGDVIDPLGATFEPVIPLFVSHDSLQVIGTAKLLKPTVSGIVFEATIAKVATPGPLQQRCDDSWAAVKNGLLRHVSVGFQPIESRPLPDRNGTLFERIEILELSLCPVPANPDARILTAKAAEAKKTAPMQEQRKLLKRFGDVIPPDLNDALNKEVSEFVESRMAEGSTGIASLKESGATQGTIDATWWGLNAMAFAGAMSRKSLHVAIWLMKEYCDVSGLAKLIADHCDKQTAKIAELETKNASLETRISRHADHLKRLENWKQGQR